MNIHLNSPITKDNLEGDYDKVILAAGSTPAMPPIPGIDTTVLASDYLTHQATVGKKSLLSVLDLLVLKQLVILQEKMEM